MMKKGNEMNALDAYRLELQTAMQMCYAEGDMEGAETYQMMLDEFDENSEDLDLGL